MFTLKGLFAGSILLLASLQINADIVQTFSIANSGWDHNTFGDIDTLSFGFKDETDFSNIVFSDLLTFKYDLESHATGTISFDGLTHNNGDFSSRFSFVGNVLSLTFNGSDSFNSWAGTDFIVGLDVNGYQQHVLTGHSSHLYSVYGDSSYYVANFSGADETVVLTSVVADVADVAVPSIVALLGLGLAGLCFSRRRSQS